MAYELAGTIKVVFEIQSFPSGFSKREFVVTTEDRYPQDVKFECVKEKTELLDKFSEGEKVNVSFDIRGNEYNDRYYVNLQAWKIDGTGEGGGTAESKGEVPLPAQGNEPADEAEDNIPF
jgi:single-strand DNA-binding protein